MNWRAPFTAIAGAKKCPKGGEALEANYAYCPWHGVKLDGATAPREGASATAPLGQARAS